MYVIYFSTFRISCVRVASFLAHFAFMVYRFCTGPCSIPIASPFWWENFIFPRVSVFDPEPSDVFLTFFTSKLSEYLIFKVSEVVLLLFSELSGHCVHNLRWYVILTIYSYIYTKFLIFSLSSFMAERLSEPL